MPLGLCLFTTLLFNQADVRPPVNVDLAGGETASNCQHVFVLGAAQDIWSRVPAQQPETEGGAADAGSGRAAAADPESVPTLKQLKQIKLAAL